MCIIGRCRNRNNFRRKKHQDNQRITVQPHGRTDRPHKWADICGAPAQISRTAALVGRYLQCARTDQPHSRTSGPIFAVRPHGNPGTRATERPINLCNYRVRELCNISQYHIQLCPQLDGYDKHTTHWIQLHLKQRCLQMESWI